ncbi:MAG: metallophosphoesterase [Paludibacter sp.]|nr:metallophosphoesterase [Paludibacter sp.]
MMTYDDITYNKNVNDGLELKNVALAHSEDCLCKELIHRFNDDAIEQDISKQSVYYITDLHLDEKIDDRYSDNSTDDEIKAYIDGVAKNIAEKFSETDDIRRKILLIGGDVSHKYEITAMFYSALSKYILPDKIIAILGNHELWDSKIKKSNSRVDTTIERYRKMFNKLKIRFLQNSILILKRMGEAVFISESEIKKLSVKKLRDKCADGTLLLLGGIGFAGRNDDLNANSGMYRETLISRDEEKRLSSNFEGLYRKLRNAVSDAPVIILTHMPMRDWSGDPYESNWCYVSGHTHKNRYYEDNGTRVFEDNQIGRKDKPIRLKYFDFGDKPDIFRYYDDGKYTLNKKTYIDFYRNLGYEIQIDRSDKVIMIKKNGFYCFFCKIDGSYRILEGGMPHRVANQDLNYYYNNLTEYGTKIIETLKPYTEYLTAVSNLVKSIKGSGKIHGCIVDIDYYNHIFVNPFDSKLTAYYATDIINKIVYPTLDDLLKERNPQLYMEYIKLIGNCSDTKILEMAHTVDLELPLTDNKKNISVQYRDTDIYGISKRIRCLQYTEKSKIIRTWDDNFVPSIKEFPPLGENITSDNICYKSPDNPYEIPYFRLMVEEFVQTINWLEKSRSTDKIVGSGSHHKLKISDREMIIKTHNKFYKGTNNLLSE